MSTANIDGLARLRVLACAFACSPSGNTELGSGEAVLGWNLVTQLARFHEVDVLSHPSNRAGVEQALQKEPVGHLTFHFFALPRWLAILQKVQGGFQIYAYLWQIQAHFVAVRLHAQNRFGAFHHLTYANDWAASYIGALLKIPYFRGPCGGTQKTPRQYLSEFGWHNRAWERVRAGMGWVLRHDPFFLLGQARARRILVCNRESLAAIPRQHQKKATLFPVNGISAQDWELIAKQNGGGAWPEPAGALPSKRFRVLSAGRLIALKGYPLAIRAFGLFASQHAESELVIAGEGPDLGKLETLAESLGLSDRIHFAGWTPRNRLLSAMCACDVFLFASYRDGGGAVVVEAMAAGKPVICLDLAGPSLHITEECGVKIPALAPDETISLMARELERLYTDSALRRKMGAAARARAEQVYSWDRLGDRLLKIYLEELEYGLSRGADGR
jgi:glycosyltransferase involved in cell wall biosynthesis